MGALEGAASVGGVVSLDLAQSLKLGCVAGGLSAGMGAKITHCDA